MEQFAERSSGRRVAINILVAGALLSSILFASAIQLRSTIAEAASGSQVALQVRQKAPHEIVDCSSAEHRRADYALTDPQIAPPGVHLSEDEIISILNRTSGASAYYSAYGLRLPSDTVGTASADVMKIVPTGHSSWPYLAVYHRHDRGDYFKTELAASRDLRTWQALRTISDASSMPDVRVLSDGSLLYAHERNPSGQRPYIDVMHFRSCRVFRPRLRACHPIFNTLS